MSHLLIIEDNFLIASYLASIAEDAGATSVAFAVTEDEAVEAASQQMPSIIFADVELKAGTGPRAVERIFSTAEKVPVVFITGTPETCYPRDPADIVLRKPVGPETITEIYKRLAPL